MEKLLHELVQRLRTAAEANLRSVVLYGSAAANLYQEKHSDLNVLCVVRRLGSAELDRLAPVVRWWQSKGHPGPMMFTEEELRRSADVFAIELLDIQAASRVLWGENIAARLEIPMQLHPINVERELVHCLVRLRQHYLAARRSPRAVRRLMLASASTAAVLFRHALLALGQPLPSDRRQAVAGLAALAGFDPKPIDGLLDLREGRRNERGFDWEAVFAAYLDAIERAAQAVDRRLAEAAAAKPAEG
ncbi:MAG TPA: hypothetical protein VGS20_10565 [Candidatus Acidoferrales bacterium]|nr:hypothetical protein [Candidatus Acidoferrales bacterium]